MTFTVTYRNADGKRDFLVLEASDKAALWVELKKRGISAISVSEGSTVAAKGNKRISMRLAVAGVIAAALLLTLYFVCSVDEKPLPAPQPRKAVTSRSEPKKALKPEGRESGTNRQEKVQPKATQPVAKLKTYRDERGILRYEGGARVPGQRPLAKPIELGSHRPKIFKHSAEEHISWMLDMKIGEPIIGDYAYGNHFLKSFKDSLAEPVEILDTDDEATRELKMAVQETKEDLRKRMAAGEDIVKIMNDTMDEYRRLARYKRDLQVELNKIKQDTENYTDQDIADFTAAANELLKKNGLPPISLPRAIMRGLRK